MMSAKQLKREEEASYYKEASEWDLSRIETIKNSEKNAWRVAAGAAVIAACAVLGLAAIVPLKQVEPYVVKVDSSTGIVEVVKRLPTVGETNYDESVTKYFLGQYLSAREGFSQKLAEPNYDRVLLMSDTNERYRYVSYFEPTKNPKAPWNVYGANITTEVKIKSISFLKKNLALIRYLLIRKNGTAVTTAHWAASIGFKYVNAPQSDTARLINPLGFIVNEYRNDPETIQGVVVADEKTSPNAGADSTLDNQPTEAEQIRTDDAPVPSSTGTQPSTAAPVVLQPAPALEQRR